MQSPSGCLGKYIITLDVEIVKLQKPPGATNTERLCMITIQARRLVQSSLNKMNYTTILHCLYRCIFYTLFFI